LTDPEKIVSWSWNLVQMGDRLLARPTTTIHNDESPWMRGGGKKRRRLYAGPHGGDYRIWFDRGDYRNEVTRK